MKILYRDLKRGVVKLQAESVDDLWLLSMLIEPGDYVRARTVREVKYGSRGSGRSSRIPMVLTIRVERVEFQPFTTRLRVRGVVVEGPERFGVKGKHHTISVDVGSELEILKPSGWPRTLLERLESSGLGVSVIVVAVDYDEYAVAVVRSQGVRYVAEGSLHLPGKDDPHWENALHEAAKTIAKLAAEAAEKENAVALVIVGPGGVKNLVAGVLKELGTAKRVIVEQASMGGRAGVEEALRRRILERVAREAAGILAEEVLEEFEKLLAKDPEMIAYGWDRVWEATEAGAVETLAILDTLLFSEDPEERKKVYELLRRADETRARIVFVPSTTPAGEKLRGLGGIVALLRYRLPYTDSQ